MHHTTRLGARLRLTLSRHPRLYWAATVACAVLAATLVTISATRLDTARASWGETRPVAVVRSSARTGTVPEIVIRDIPVAVLPDSPLDQLPTGVVAAHDLASGEILTENDLVSPHLADGVRMAVPARGAPDLAIGQTALLLTIDGGRCEGPVIAHDDEWLDVAVTERCATTVALAVLAGDLVVAAIGP